MAESESPTGEILFPEKVVIISGGRRVVIEPWGLKTGKLLGPRVASLFVRLRGFDAAHLVELLTDAQDEVTFIVQKTIGWTDDEMEKITYEDLFVLAQGVIEICIVRVGRAGKIEGPFAAILGLAGLTPEAMLAGIAQTLRKKTTAPTTTDSSPSPSSSSSPADTPPATSSSTPTPS